MRVAKHTEPDDGFITAQELGRQLGVSEASLARWRLWGQGPPFLRLTGQRVVRYAKRDVAEWLAARQHGAGR
jgi:predicted DNA-binding transcriptional regulator AlpA